MLRLLSLKLKAMSATIGKYRNTKLKTMIACSQRLRVYSSGAIIDLDRRRGAADARRVGAVMSIGNPALALCGDRLEPQAEEGHIHEDERQRRPERPIPRRAELLLNQVRDHDAVGPTEQIGREK